MQLVGTNSAWDGRVVRADVYEKNGIWIADPEGTSYGRYRCHSLVFTNTAPAPNTGRWMGISQIPEGYDVDWNLHVVGNTADGFPVWAWSTPYGSTECVDPSEWSDRTLQAGETLSSFLSRHTKKQLEDIGQERILQVDLYLNGENKFNQLTLHWKNKLQQELDIYVSWRPSGSPLLTLHRTESYGELVSPFLGTGYVTETIYATQDNEGGTYDTWGDLDRLTFKNLSDEQKIILNRLSLNPTSSADYYNLVFVAKRMTADSEGTVHYLTSQRILCSIPRTIPASASEIGYDVRYVQSLDENMNIEVIFNVHINEEIPSEVQDDINLTREKGDDNYTNKGNENSVKDANIEDATGVETTGLLTTTYALTAERCRILGQNLWTQAYFNVLKVQSNPIENIVACKAFPFSISGSESSIVIGDINMNCTGAKVSKNTEVVTVGSITIERHFKNFLDYAPFTEISIYLPYVGIKQLDTNMVVGQTITIDYIVDLLTGAGRARIKLGTTIISEYDCTIGIDIPLTSSDRAQADAKHLASIGMGIAFGASSGAVGAIAGGVSGVINGIGDGYHMSQTSGGSPTVSSYDNKSCFLIFNRPVPISSSNYKHTHGKPCQKTFSISELQGYTEISQIDLSGLILTQEEETELRDILLNGFYI